MTPKQFNNLHFNSTIVRLGDHYAKHKDHAKDDFNSTIVRLGGWSKIGFVVTKLISILR